MARSEAVPDDRLRTMGIEALEKLVELVFSLDKHQGVIKGAPL